MPIHVGPDKILDDLRLGGVTPTAVHVGATKVWPEPAPSVTLTSDVTNVNIGGVVTFTAAATGTGPFTYIWQELLSGGSWANISGATGTTYARTAVAADDDAQIRVLVRDAYYPANPQAISNAITITVNAAVGASIAPTTGVGYTGTVVNLTCTPSGGNGTFTYQWKVNGANVGGATAATYAHTITANGQAITCVVTSAGASATSNTSTMTMYAALAASIAPTTGAGYSGTVVNHTATPSGGSGTYTYQWKVNGANVGGATAATYAHTITANGQAITCVVTSAGASVTSNTSTMTMYAAVGSSVAPTALSGLDGTVVAMTCTPSGGSGTYTYQWYLSAPNTAIGGATAATYSKTLVAAETGRGIFCQVSSAGQAANSNVAIMTVSLAQPGPPVLPPSTTSSYYYNAQPANLTDVNGARPAVVGQKITQIHEANGVGASYGLVFGVPAGNAFTLRQQADGRYYLEGSAPTSASNSGDIYQVLANATYNPPLERFGNWFVTGTDSTQGNLAEHGAWKAAVGGLGGLAVVPFSGSTFFEVRSSGSFVAAAQISIDVNRPMVSVGGNGGFADYAEINANPVPFTQQQSPPAGQAIDLIHGYIGWMFNTHRWYETGYYICGTDQTNATLTALSNDRMAVYSSL